MAYAPPPLPRWFRRAMVICLVLELLVFLGLLSAILMENAL